MFSSFGESFQLGVDCMAAIGEGRYVVFGWHMTPRGLPVEISFVAPDGRVGRVEYISRHPRPDVTPQDPGAAEVAGFSLVLVAPHAARGLVLRITAGDASGQAELADPALADLLRATELRDWGLTFGMLRECMERPDILPLLHYQYRPFGAFAGWMALLPLVQGKGKNVSIVAHAAAAISPAGEVALDLRFIGRSRGTVEVEVLAIASLRSDDGGPDHIALLPLHDVVTRNVPGASAFYARMDWADVPRLRGVELVVQVTFDSERVWLRCQPEPETVPGFLDMLGAATANQRGGQTLLRDVIQKRTILAQALLRADQERSADKPAASARAELALVGVDDAWATRLLHLLAPELEASASAIILLGSAAEAAEQIFTRRGRIPAMVASDPGAMLGRAEAVGADNVIALDMPSLAAASIEGGLGRVLRNSRGGGMRRLLLLHSLAGPTASLGESFARHASMMDRPDQPWLPISIHWRNSSGAEWVNEHLEAIWRYLLPPDPAGGSVAA